MADLALIGTLTRSSVFVSICKSVYIVFRSIAARKVHLYIHFTPIFSTFHSFQNAKTVLIFNQNAYIFIFCLFLPYCIPHSSSLSRSASFSNECFSRRSIPYIRLTAATIKSAIESPFDSAYSFSKRLLPFGMNIPNCSYFSL